MSICVSLYVFLLVCKHMSACTCLHARVYGFNGLPLTHPPLHFAVNLKQAPNSTSQSSWSQLSSKPSVCWSVASYLPLARSLYKTSTFFIQAVKKQCSTFMDQLQQLQQLRQLMQVKAGDKNICAVRLKKCVSIVGV